MNRNIHRRNFIKSSAGATMETIFFPDSYILPEGFGEYHPLQNVHTGSSDIIINIDWNEMMKNHDLIWTKVPEDMSEATHSGNGLIRSMFWIEENRIRLQILRSDVYDSTNETFGWMTYSLTRYQIGYFTLNTSGNITGCDFRQDLSNAELRASITTSKGGLKIDHFVHRYDDVIYTGIETHYNKELPEWQNDLAILPIATAYYPKGKRNGDGRCHEMVDCLPRLLDNCWLHYRNSMERELLKILVFPLLQRSVNICRHFQDGKLHLPLTFSPETGYVRDCNFDPNLLKRGSTNLIEIGGILKTVDPLPPEWKNIITQLTDYPVDERAYRLGSDKTTPEDHQHISHLTLMYSLYFENIGNCNDKNLLELSVRNFQPVTMPKIGASHSSPPAAALGSGNLALQRMHEILNREPANEKPGKNGIYYLATPCIETSMSFNTCVQDILLQSWGNKIRVFSAMPEIWQDVAFHNFRAEAAFLVIASRQNGITVFVRIKSLAEEASIIMLSIDGIPGFYSQNSTNQNEIEKGCYKIDLKKGVEAIFWSGNKMPQPIITTVQAKKKYMNKKWSYSLVPGLVGLNKPVQENAVSVSICRLPAWRQGVWNYMPGTGSGGWLRGYDSPLHFYTLARLPGETLKLSSKNPELLTQIIVLLKKSSPTDKALVHHQ